MSRGQRLVRKLANQQRCYSQLSRHISTLKRNRDNMGTYNSSTQSSPLKPSPALTFSSQCAKCFANGAHLAVSWHSSCRAGRIYARREQVTTRRVQHRTKRNTHLRAPPLPPQQSNHPHVYVCISFSLSSSPSELRGSDHLDLWIIFSQAVGGCRNWAPCSAALFWHCPNEFPGGAKATVRHNYVSGLLRGEYLYYT